MRIVDVLALSGLSLVITETRVNAQSAENVAVIINEASPASVQIGEHYILGRAIPRANVIRIQTTIDETIERPAFIHTIQRPIAAALARERLQDRILYLVLTKGVPLRIAGSGGQNGTTASVDSELTVLYRHMVGGRAPVVGRIPNPYYLDTASVSTAAPFTRRAHDIYLVTRLDAFSVDEALALVDKGLAPATAGHIVLDQQNASVNRVGERWLSEAAKRLAAAGHGDRVRLETTVAPARNVTPVMGYYSWGSNDPRNQVRRFDMGFAAGSLAAMFIGSDARTFQEPPASWTPSNQRALSASFGGSPHSLVGDLIREGATGVAGQITEAYLQSAVRPDILFSAYLAGFNLAESFYLAIPDLSWQTVVIGDPLCAPFAQAHLFHTTSDDDIDALTELPSLFAKRRMATIMALEKNSSEPAIGLALRAEGRATRGDFIGAREALEESTRLGPEIVTTQLELAFLYEQLAQHEEARERYRRVIALQPRHAVALNNLAYSQAVHLGELVPAKAFAERALSAAPQTRPRLWSIGNRLNLPPALLQASILDTLGWIAYLSGEHAAAVQLLATAARTTPHNAEVRLHAAFALEATGARATADEELNAALKHAPELGQRDDVKELRQRIAAPPRTQAPVTTAAP